MKNNIYILIVDPTPNVSPPSPKQQRKRRPPVHQGIFYFYKINLKLIIKIQILNDKSLFVMCYDKNLFIDAVKKSV